MTDKLEVSVILDPKTGKAMCELCHAILSANNPSEFPAILLDHCMKAHPPAGYTDKDKVRFMVDKIDIDKI